MKLVGRTKVPTCNLLTGRAFRGLGYGKTGYAIRAGGYRNFAFNAFGNDEALVSLVSIGSESACACLIGLSRQNWPRGGLKLSRNWQTRRRLARPLALRLDGSASTERAGDLA